jgi:glutathione synthase/RimK-type ligase-like ATP-grasp enzyme
MCEISSILEFKFGAIDLIKHPNGEYYFWENNPNGQWAWIEMDTGMLISQAIIKFLYAE